MPVKFTVVSIAYRRREYLTHALRSIVAQTIDPARVEVVVVKDFSEAEVDSIIREHGFASIESSEARVGRKIREALQITTGDVVSVLDDDDLWEPEKLASVGSDFDSSTDLDYLGHGQSLVGPDGAPAPPGYRPSPEYSRQLLLRSPLEIGPGPFREDELARFVSRSPGNNSSASLRRKVLVDVDSYLEEVPYSIDTFLLYAALSAGRRLRLDPRRLTRLRVHSVNMSQLRPQSYRSFLTGYGQMMNRFVAGHRVILRMAQDRADPVVSRLLQADLDRLEHFRAVAQHEVQRGATARSLLRGLRSPVRPHRGLLVSEALSVISPSMARVGNYFSGLRRWSG